MAAASDPRVLLRYSDPPTCNQPHHLANTTWQKEKVAGADSSDLRPIWLRR
jgi:hypothetical protein